MARYNRARGRIVVDLTNAVPMDYEISTLVAWLLIALTGVGAVYTLAVLLQIRIYLAIILAIFFGIACFYVLDTIQLFIEPVKVSVIVVSPKNNSKIAGTKLHVVGTVSPSDSRVTLIASSETDRFWWIQPFAEVAKDGSWSSDVYLGTKTEGVNELFQIVALASANSILYDLLTNRYLVTGTKRTTIPNWGQSTPINVVRIK
jgi:hypothetical protein